MVKVSVKVEGSKKDDLLHETAADTPVDVLISELVEKWNQKQKLIVLAQLLEELAEHGPMKAEKDKGIDHIQEEEIKVCGGQLPKRSENYNEDPLGERTGEAPCERLKNVLKEAVRQAKETVDFCEFKVISREDLQEKIHTMRGSVIMAYPMGLPKCDPLFSLLDEPEQKKFKIHEQLEAGLDPETAQLWWAGKELLRGTLLSERVGTNDKTKIKCRLMKKGSGPPLREPIVNEKERKAMMAHFYKKQEEMKRLHENDEDFYLTQSWADPNGLKSKLNGTQNIRMF